MAEGTPRLNWRQAFENLIARHDYVIIGVVGMTIDGRCTKIDDGIYKVDHHVIDKTTGELVSVETVVPFESIAWAGSLPAPKSTAPAGAITAAEMEELLKVSP